MPRCPKTHDFWPLRWSLLRLMLRCSQRILHIRVNESQVHSTGASTLRGRQSLLEEASSSHEGILALVLAWHYILFFCHVTLDFKCLMTLGLGLRASEFEKLILVRSPPQFRQFPCSSLYSSAQIWSISTLDFEILALTCRDVGFGIRIRDLDSSMLGH